MTAALASSVTGPDVQWVPGKIFFFLYFDVYFYNLKLFNSVASGFYVAIHLLQAMMIGWSRGHPS